MFLGGGNVTTELEPSVAARAVTLATASTPVAKKPWIAQFTKQTLGGVTCARDGILTRLKLTNYEWIAIYGESENPISPSA